MAREGGKDRGLFQRKGSPDWWIRWVCPYGHEHREKIDPKSLARMVYQRRKVAVKVEGYCLTQERDKRHQEQPALFRDVARRYLAWGKEQRPRSYTFRNTALKHLVAAFDTTPLSNITRADVEAYQSRRQHDGVRPGTINRERSVLSHLFTKDQAWGLVQSNPVMGTERAAGRAHGQPPGAGLGRRPAARGATGWAGAVGGKGRLIFLCSAFTPGHPCALPSPILRRLSSTSQRHAAPCSAWLRAALARQPRRSGRHGRAVRTVGRH